MLLKGFEVLFQQFESGDIGVFVLEKFELDLLPFGDHNFYLLAHFKFLFGSVRNVLYFVFEIKQFQVPNGLDLQTVICNEILLDAFSDFGPVPSVLDFHAWILKFV